MTSILTGVLAALTHPVSVRDALPDTEAGSVSEALGVLAALDQTRSLLGALDATWQVTAANRITTADTTRGLPTAARGRAAAMEIALARRVSPAASSQSLAASRRLVTQLPHTLELLAQGRLSEQHARTIALALDGADPDLAHQIDEFLSTDPARLDGIGTRALGAQVRALRDAVCPADSRRRARRAARGRHVHIRFLADHMTEVTATLTAVDAMTVTSALRSEAEARRAHGSRDGIRALEADALVDAIAGSPWASTTCSSTTRSSTTCSSTTCSSTPPDPPRGTGRLGHRQISVGVVMTEQALLDPDGAGQLALLEGYGPIPAHLICDTLRATPPGHYDGGPPEDAHPDVTTGAVMRRLFTHPATGELLALESKSRAFPVTLDRLIRWRDATCATPWCNARVRHLDHVISHADGGPTAYANGQGLCARCNLHKDHPGWTITPARDPDGAPTVHWETPGGAQGIHHTPPLDPRRLTHPPRPPRPPGRQPDRQPRLDPTDDPAPPGDPPG